ncbi:hypothetical protein BDV35DRAFT_383061 [Aspergillus flavus]|uniref:Uncharacterized protein n=1 Tax=Aspergillus flavus TaxID=5059 RepID=A0A5N6GNR6_ASPFL|nr:hypothetical protein BDV35DRAFT_383061 [Aspergillus flavus]
MSADKRRYADNRLLSKPGPVIIPQRRPGNKDRGFVRAYASVLADCDISQVVFLNFLEGSFQASKAVYVAAGIVGLFPETAAQITSVIVQTVAGTAREIQSWHRANTFLDRVNQELFMPRRLYAMVMAFKDDLGKTLFGIEKVDINQPVEKPTFDPAPTIAKYTHSDEHPEMNMVKKHLKNIRLASGKTHGQIKLPVAAPGEPEGSLEKVKSAGAWEAKNPGSSLAVPESGRKGFVSRYDDPNHPVINGKISSVLTGSLLGSKSGLIERAATSIKESHDSKRIARGKPPSEPIKEKWHRYQRKKKPGLAKNVLQQDDELQQSIAQLEHLMQQAG